MKTNNQAVLIINKLGVQFVIFILGIIPSFCFAQEIKNHNFPVELVNFTSYEKNPVLSGTGQNTWDQQIRERGWIMKEDGVFHMWYSGYNTPDGKQTECHLGYATSVDGLQWTKYENNPVYNAGWVEDVCVVKSKGVYYMFAENKDKQTSLLTSTDRVNWENKGSIIVRKTNGVPITGWFGTPSVWLENDIWYLLYERDDHGIWLAKSNIADLNSWSNVQDEPVLKNGPEVYDKYAIAVDQVFKYQGAYYAYYHASEYEDWHEWTSCIAKSDDLIHWKKYEKNPLLRENKSSPILVIDGDNYMLYSMHPNVCVHLSKK